MKTLFIFLLTSFTCAKAIAMPFGTYDTSSLENKIKKIGTLYGGIDDFYFKNDSLNDAARMNYSEKIWRCIPYKGQLPEDTAYNGIAIRGGNCPINYVRGFNATLNSGFAEYTTTNSEILNLLNVGDWRSDFSFKSETKGNVDVLTYQIKSNYTFTDSTTIHLTMGHELQLAQDNKVADRVTHARFQDNETSLLLRYQVHSDASRIEKKCSVDDVIVDCAQFYQRFGAIELIPNW